MKEVTTGSVCPTCFGATEAKQSWQGCAGVRWSRVWSSLISPALLLVPWLELWADLTHFPHLCSQVRQACVLLDARRVLMSKFSFSLATSCLLGGAAGGEARVGRWWLLRSGCCGLPTGKWFSSQRAPPRCPKEEFWDPRQQQVTEPWPGGLPPKALPGPVSCPPANLTCHFSRPCRPPPPQVLRAWWEGGSLRAADHGRALERRRHITGTIIRPPRHLSSCNVSVLHSHSGPGSPKKSPVFTGICPIYNGRSRLEHVASLQPFPQAFYNSCKNWRFEIWTSKYITESDHHSGALWDTCLGMLLPPPPPRISICQKIVNDKGEVVL